MMSVVAAATEEMIIARGVSLQVFMFPLICCCYIQPLSLTVSGGHPLFMITPLSDNTHTHTRASLQTNASVSNG